MKIKPLESIQQKASEKSCCSPGDARLNPDCNGAGGLTRRRFVRAAGLGMTGLLLSRGETARAIAGPFMAADFEEHLIPADKKFNPAWMRSLFERGEPTVYRSTAGELDKIGMPIGGICTGQLYLGGDGKLWHWDVFNLAAPEEMRDYRGPHYAKPMQATSPIEQGFAIRVTPRGASAQPQTRRLDKSGFREISFRGQYPIGFVEYRDATLPVEISLEAFSPFIPLNEDDSGLPATVMHYRVKNISDVAVEVELAGWLQNAVCIASGKAGVGIRRNRVVREGRTTLLNCSAEVTPASTKDTIPLEQQPDFGTMVLALLESDARDTASAAAGEGPFPEAAFGGAAREETRLFGQNLVGTVRRKRTLKPREQATFTFVIAWHFDGLWWDSMKRLKDFQQLRRHYGTRFQSAVEVVRYVEKNFDRLASETRLWHRTWYDSTLPYWLLDRTLLTISTLATATCYRFNNGRFYGWEGTYCCAGTCTHVWQYAQAVARLFPKLERSTREIVDFGLAFHEDTGLIDYRAEAARQLAVDGHAGTILRAYREHQMSADDAFLRRNWPRIKKAIELLIQRDVDSDGILDGEQYNTLDASWYGQIAWISSLYLAAVRAGEQMAREMGDTDFAERAQRITTRGRQEMVARLYNGEYFIHLPDPNHPEAINTNIGCHADQVFGQSWAFQVGLGRILPERETRSALRSLYRYNFAPDVGAYREKFKVLPAGRWYAMPGEGGLLLCTWPKGGAEKASGKGGNPVFVGYFNECWTGFEYQVAAHMIWEGLVQEGLAITRMVHDRHHAARRNPWNEIECSDHYARAMSSYGVFTAVCGYEHHGPNGHLGFAPRVTSEAFRAPFTTAEGWGTFSQSRKRGSQHEKIEVKWGRLKLSTLSFDLADGPQLRKVKVSVAGRKVPTSVARERDKVTVTFAKPVSIEAGQTLDVVIT
jgi:uncharacterized protein (DUF608 family)